MVSKNVEAYNKVFPVPTKNPGNDPEEVRDAEALSDLNPDDEEEEEDDKSFRRKL